MNRAQGTSGPSRNQFWRPGGGPGHGSRGVCGMASTRPIPKNPALRRGGDSHLVARAGVEPATFHFSGERYYQLSYLADRRFFTYPATPTGLEPATSAVTGRRANQLRHGANLWPTGFLPARVTLAVLPGFGKSGIPTAWPPVQEYSARSLPGIPNGIRTRVAAVKGRSPRPLDDGDQPREG